MQKILDHADSTNKIGERLDFRQSPLVQQRTLICRQSRLKSMDAAARGLVSAGLSEADSTRAG